MEDRINEIFKHYKTEIAGIAEENINSYSNIKKGIQISRKYLQSLRVVLRNGKFRDKKSEIRFFKEQKPYIYGRLKFFAKLHTFYTYKPLGSFKNQCEYIDTEIGKVQSYYQKNIDFLKYYRENATVLDEFYFLRGNENIALISDTSHFYTDPEFSTSHDNAVAKIIVYDLLLAFYIEELNRLRNCRRKSIHSRKKFKQ